MNIKFLAECGKIWRKVFLWNGKLTKVANVGMYRCYCRRCGLKVINFNQWTPEFNICIPCHIKK